MFAGTVSCLEERLAQLHLATSPEQESPESDLNHQSVSDRVSLSTFESYVKGMVGNVVSNIGKFNRV